MAINAFAIAQVVSAFVTLIGHYIFFYIYIRRLNAHRQDLVATRKKSDGDDIQSTNISDETTSDKGYQNMDDFPFTKISEMVPGILDNNVTYFACEFIK